MREPLRLVLAGTMIRIEDGHHAAAGSFTCDDGQGGPAEFTVNIPGKISRRYLGKLEIKAQPRELLIIIGMDVETAVASIVVAESPPHAPMEALKAQAVAARSFLAAGKGRHSGFDFCDTTHCQFLRQPPAADSPAAQATSATRGLVLAYKGRGFAAMYSASCGGGGHSPAEVGNSLRGYPFFCGIFCQFRRHPAKNVGPNTPAERATLPTPAKPRA